MLGKCSAWSCASALPLFEAVSPPFLLPLQLAWFFLSFALVDNPSLSSKWPQYRIKSSLFSLFHIANTDF